MKIGMPRTFLLRFAVVLLSAGTLGASALHAQDGPPQGPPQGRPGGPGGGPEMQQRQLDHMTKELSLTPDQVTQIKAIQMDGRTKMMALRDDTTVAGPDKRAKMMAMRETEQTKVKAVLTDAQRIKYDTMMQKMMEQREHRQDGSAPPPPPPPPPPSN